MSSRPVQRMLLLQQQRRKALESLGAAGAQGHDIALLKELTDRLRVLDIAIAEEASPARRRWLLIFGAIVATTVTLLATVRIWWADVDVVVEASAVQLTFDGTDNLAGLVFAGPVHVSGFSAAHLRDASGVGSDADSATVTAPTVRLKSLRTEKDNVLAITAGVGDVELALTTASADPSTVSLEAQGGGTLVFRQLPGLGTRTPETHALSETEVLRFSFSRESSPFRIGTTNLRALELGPTHVKQIDFRQPSAPIDTLARSESSLQRAKVKVSAKREVRLEEGHELRISGLQPRTVRIRSCFAEAGKPATCKGLAVQYQGRASDIEVRRAGRSEDLSPTFLEYFKESSLIGLLWGAAVFLWGTGWSVWKSLAR